MRRFVCGVAGWLLALPVAPWGWYHERRILHNGRELTDVELADARVIGVLRPERVLRSAKLPALQAVRENVLEKNIR